MNPVRSNLNKEGCSPVSSNCVTWQGPDIQCINLCKGDTISEVTYKIAAEICDLKDRIGLTDIDLTCLVQVCQTTPEPTKTLNNILTLLINKVCCLSDIVNNIPDPGTPYVEPTLNLYACLKYQDQFGNTVNQLPLSQYVLQMASVLCQTVQTVSIDHPQVVQNTADIAALMNATNPVLQVQSCLSGSVTDIDVALENLETTFCSYKNVLGSTTDLTKVYSQPYVCVNGSTKQLMNPKVGMSNMTGWNNTPTNLGQILQNMWLTICDMRGAVKSILDTCCQVSCESISIKISYKWIDQNTLRLFFTGSTLPMGFYDCDQSQNGGTLFTLTDGLGNTAPVHIKLRNSDPTITDGVLDDLTNLPVYHFDITDIGSSTSLDVTTGLVMTSDACFTNGDATCIKCLSLNIAAYVSKACCVITATSPVTIVYKVCYDVTTTTTTTTIAP